MTTTSSLPGGRELISLPPRQPMRLRDFTFNNNGERVYAMRLDGRVYEWNLAELHRELAKLALDWQ